MNRELLVSIIVNNYNYERFLREAIDSALNQTYRHIEVIVVDDGSTDNSREVIQSYGNRVVPILKANRGQASAFNAGLAGARGDVVIFLDADDVLLPDIVERVVKIFCAHPLVAKVQYRMEIIDAQSRSTGVVKPPTYLPMPNGDYRRHILKFPDDVPWMSTSGNAFSVPILRQIFSVPERPDGHGADWYLALITPLFGTVISLEEVGAYYRMHDSNFYTVRHLDLEWVRLAINLMTYTHVYIAKFANYLGLDGVPKDPTRVLSVAYLGHRLISLKLDPKHHPMKEDSVLRLLIKGTIASFRRFDVPFPMRLLFSSWFLAMALSAGRLARWCAETFLFPESNGLLRRILAVSHKSTLPTS